MADNANLELNISSSLDASVRQSFAAIEKLFKSLEKSLGSLNSSMEKLAGVGTKLESSMDNVTASAVKATDTIERIGIAAEESAEKVAASSKRIKKSSLEQADINRVTSKQYMTNIRLADNYSQRLDHINNTVKKTSKEYGLQVAALTKTEKSYQAFIKSIDMSVERVSKMEKELANLREERSKYATNSNEALILDPQIERLEKRLARIRHLTTVEGHKAVVSAFDYDRVFQKNLKSIRKSQIFTETEKHIQKLSEYGDYAVEIYNRLTKSMDDGSAQRKSLFNDIKKYGDTYHKELARLDTDIRTAYGLRMDATDVAIRDRYNKQIEDLKARRELLIEETTNPIKALTTYDNKRTSIADEAVNVSKYAKSVNELRTAYGQWAVNIFEDVAGGVDETSRQFKREFDNIKKYGDKYIDELGRIESKLRTINSELNSPDLSDERRRSLEQRLAETTRERLQYIDMITGSSAVSNYHASRSRLGDETIPLSNLAKYTNKIASYGDSAKSLFSYLNHGLDENSRKIKTNYDLITRFFGSYDKQRVKLQSQLDAVNLDLDKEGLSYQKVNGLKRTRARLEREIRELDTSYLPSNIINTFASFGKGTGLKTVLSKWEEIGQKVSWVSKAVQDIKANTVEGSQEQQAALGRLNNYWKQWNDTIDGARASVRGAKAELAELRATAAPQTAIAGVENKLRELRNVNKSAISSFGGINIMDDTVYKTFGKDFERYSSKLLQDETYFGKTARKLIIGLNDPKEWASTIPQLEALSAAYNRVIPTLHRLIEVNGLSSEQAKQLIRDEFLKQAALEKTTAGVKKAAEQQVGFNHVTRASASIFDRMAASMGSMARYAFASSVYYAATNAIYSTIDAVAKFDQSLKNLQAITDATDNEIAALGDEIKKVAVETRYSINEVADGATIIGQAGYSATETVSILGSAMNLAQGSMSTVTASADLLTTVLASFNLQASDAAMVADNMAAAMNYSKLDIDKLRVAFNYVGPVAMDAGASLQEMSAILMVLANNGMKASTIGTSIRNVFSQLQSPSGALRKVFEEQLGTEKAEQYLARLADKSVDVSDKFKLLNEVLGTNNNLFKLFGLRAAGTVSILTKYYTQIQEMEQGLYTLGEAQRMADKQMEGLANRMSNFGASLEVLGVTISEQPSKLLSDMVYGATKLVQGLTVLVDGPLGAAIVSFGTLVSAIGSAVVAGRLFSALFGVKLSTAIVSTNRMISSGIVSLGALTTGTTAAGVAASGTAKSFHRLGAAFRLFSTSHPILALLTAISVAVVALSGIWTTMWKEDDKATTAFQQNMKKRRDEIGLLRSAIEYNEKITDDNRRARNNAYVASNVPDIASSLLGADSKETTRDILTNRLAETEARLIKDSAEQAERSIANTNSLLEKRNELLAKFSAIRPVPDFGDAQLEQEYISIFGSVESQQEQLENQLFGLNEKIKQSTNDTTIAFSGILDTATKTAQSYVGQGMSIESAWEKTITVIKNMLADMSEDAKKAFDVEANIAKAGFFSTNNISVAGNNIEGLTERLNKMELEGEAIVRTYKALGVDMGRLVKEVIAAEKAFDKLDKAQMESKDKESAKQLLIDQTNAKLIKGSIQNKQLELAWVDKLRQHEVDSINATTKTRVERAEAVRAVNTAYYTEEKKRAEEILRATIQQIIDLNKLAGVNVEKTFTLLVEGKYKNISPDLWKVFLEGGHTNTLYRVWETTDKLEASKKPIEDERFGVVPRRDFAAKKNEYDATITLAERDYEFGAISSTSYTDKRIAAREALIKAEQAYVDELKKTKKTEEDEAQYKKAVEALEENKAKASYEAEKMRREDALQALENSHNRKMFLLDQEAAAYENRDMNEQSRQMELLRIDERRIQQNIANINAELKLKISDQRRTELGLELDREKLELSKNQVEQARKLYEIRTKYIEQEYKYGLQTKQDYRNYIEKQQREGTMNPYDAQKELWRTSDNPYEGYLLGLTEIADATQTMNDYISEGVANFRDEWHSAMDEFVESWWDGTASASEIFGDFVNNIAMDWQKRILKMYSDRMFEGFAKSFLGEELRGTYTKFGGGMATNITTDLGLPQTNNVPDAQVYVGGQLVQAVSATTQNVQTNINAATNSMANDVASMSNQSTSLLTSMTNGAANLWQFLANGFNGLWNNIGSGLSGLLASLSFATTASSGGSFFERWMGNSLGMGFQLVSMNMGGGQQSRVDANYKGMQAVGEAGYDALWNQMFGSAKGNVFKGINGFSNSIVSSPTLFTYGEHLKAFAKGAGVMGEVGPEAIMPLTRDGSGRLGVNASGMSPCINNIYIETPEGYTAEQTSRVANNNGGEDIMFTIVKQTAANVAQPGSPMYRAMQNTFGASQVLTSR